MISGKTITWRVRKPSPGVPAGSNKQSLSASLFKDNVVYRAEMYCGNAKSSQNFKLNSKPSGYISNVTLSGKGANNLPTLFTLDYNLKNAKNPYLCIKKQLFRSHCNKNVPEQLPYQYTPRLFVD